MKEFDKIYLVKYNDILTPRQLAEDLHTSTREIESIIDELKNIGLYEIYKNISDEEWEMLEKESDDYIFKEYINKSDIQNQKAWKELIDTFRPKKHNFIEYDPIKDEIKRRMNMVIVEEDWKQIKEFHYSLSNYGRVRNDLTGKIKDRRMHKGIIQVDIYENSKRYTVSIKRAVANLFIRELRPGERVRCIDGDGNNLYYKNLEIVSK